ALFGVLDFDLGDLVGVVGRQLDVGERRAGRRHRVRQVVRLLAPLRQPKPQEEHHEYTGRCVDLLFGLHGYRLLLMGSQSRLMLSLPPSRRRQRKMPMPANRRGQTRVRVRSTFFCVFLRASRNSSSFFLIELSSSLASIVGRVRPSYVRFGSPRILALAA